MSAKTILDEAAEIVDGARQTAYGHPRDNHACTGEMWTSYLQRRGILAEGAMLDARDVCILNILQKASREANTRKRDNLVDIAGFARNAEMVSEEDAALDPPVGQEVLGVVKKAIDDFRAHYGRRPSSIMQNHPALRGVASLFGITVRESFMVPPGSISLVFDDGYSIARTVAIERP